jgi:hypothetical protein
MDRPATRVQQALEEPVALVKEYPFSSMLVLFGVGMGVGVLLSQTLCTPLLHMAQAEPSVAERLGRQIMSAVHQVVPQSMTPQFLQ